MAKQSDIAIPRRIYHWINLISIIALIISGFNIHKASPTDGITMGTARMIHFIFMWIFGANVLLRIYWAFFGRGGDWKKYLAQRWFSGEVWSATIRHYVKFEHFPNHIKDRLLQNTAYGLMAVLFLFQILTGLILYMPLNETMSSFAASLGGLQSVRHIHLFMLYFFAAFTIVHLYMSFSEEFDKIKLMLFSVADEKE